VADVNSGGPDQFDKIWFTDGTKTVGVTPTSSDSAATPTTMVFDMSLDPFVITAGGSKIFTVKVDTANVDRNNNSKGSSNEGFQLSVNATGDVTARGSQSGTAATVSGTPSFNAFTLYRSVPTVDITSGVTNKLTGNGVYELFKFTVSADPKGPIGVYKFTFGITTTTVSYSSLEVRDSSYTAGPVFTQSSVTETGEGGNVVLVNALFDTDSSGTGAGGEFREVPAGGSRTFTLKATVSGYTSNVSNGVVTVLAGDAAFGSTAALEDAVEVDAYDQDDFIWSDFSYTTQYNSSTATYTEEWANGFRVKGLDSTTGTAQAI
jgi:hypothetical protein